MPGICINSSVRPVIGCIIEMKRNQNIVYINKYDAARIFLNCFNSDRMPFREVNLQDPGKVICIACYCAGIVINM